MRVWGRPTVNLAILLLLAVCTCSAQQPSTEPSATSGNQQRSRRQDSNGLQDPQEPQTLHNARLHQGSTFVPGPVKENYYQKGEQSEGDQVNGQQLNGAQDAGSNLAADHEERHHYSISRGSQGPHAHRQRKFAHPRRKSSGNVPGRAGRDFPSLSVIPRTGFRCKRGHPGYFADPETGCQVFHICQTTGRKSSFLCPAGSIFNQRYLVCDWWFDTTCGVRPNHVPQTTGLDDNSISPGQGDLSLEASVYPRKPGGIHGNNVDDTASSKPAIQQSNRNNNRHGSTYSFSFSQEHEPNTAAKFNHALTKFSPGVSSPQTEAFTVSSVNFDSTKPPNSHHSYQSQNFFFPHRFPTMSPSLAQTARPKYDQVESNSSTPYNHRPTYDAEPEDSSLKQEDQNTFSERNEQPAYSPDNRNANVQTPSLNYEQTSLLGESNAQPLTESNAQPLTSSAPDLNNAPVYNGQSNANQNQFYSPEARTVSTTTSSPLTSSYPQINNEYQSSSQYQQTNNQASANQYTQTYSEFASISSNQYQDVNQQNNNQYQETGSQYPQTVNQYQSDYSNQYQQTSTQYPLSVNEYQTNYSQYQPTDHHYQLNNRYQQSNSQYEQTNNQNVNNNQYQFDNTTPAAFPIDLNSTQPQQYPTNTAAPQTVQHPITTFQQPITNYQQPNYQQPITYQQPRESLLTSSSGNILDNNQQYSTTAPFVPETTQLSTDQTFTTVPNKSYSNVADFSSTPIPEVSNDIRTNLYTDQTAPSTFEATTQTTPPQTTLQPTDFTSSPKPVDVPTITQVPYHESFSVTPSSPSPFTLSTTHSPLSENDIETTEQPSTDDDLQTTSDVSDSQTTFLGDANKINHALDSSVKPIDVEIDNHQSSVDNNHSPSPTPFTFNVGQGFAQEATPTSTPTSNHFSRFIIDIPDEVSSIKSTSFGQVGNEVQDPVEHAVPSYPFTARVNDFLSAIGHHDTPTVTSPPENVTDVTITQTPSTVTKLDKFTLADVSSPSNEVKASLASSDSHSAAASVSSLPFGARLRAPKRRIYRRRIVV